MEFGIVEILKLIGALGFFIYGMKIMSEACKNKFNICFRLIIKH